MKTINFLFYLILFTKLIIKSLSQYDYIYEPIDVINYINKENQMDAEDLESIIDYLIDIFNDAYAFNEISINPPQPSLNNDYHKKVDIYSSLTKIKEKIRNNEITKVYDFYSEISYSISQLKDCHIQINWNQLNLDEFFVIAPINFIIREEENGEPKLYANCLSDDFLVDINLPLDFDENILEECDNNSEFSIQSINDKNPFDYINDFGSNLLSTKNEHATFSFKLQYHNDLPLSDYPLKIEEFEQLIIEFESGDTIETKYYIGSGIDINNGERRNLKNIIKNKKRKNKKNKKRNLYSKIKWYHETKGEDVDIFKCYEDTINKINVYYISSFNPKDKVNYIKAFEDCYTHFDKNDYPILVINDLNDGGLVYLSQIFLGIISPLIPIDLYKGRIKISDSFKETEEIRNYIETNLTSSENCLHTNYERLTSQRVQVNYDKDIKIDLTQMFFLNNITIHNYIENARKNMEHKRKPNEILIFTDGYSFSAASLFIQYLQKSGGAIIASYLGNPNRKDKIFDISQSPSPVFTHNLLKIFSPENYNNLLNMNGEENSWEIQIPGIQTFYDIEDYDNPLEYEVIPPDINSNISVNFDEELYEKFINKAKEILEKYKNECNPNNKNLIKISEKCDNSFGNKYTHGGFECGDNGKWNNICVPSYCDPGYFFNKKKKQCIKDICSSIPIDINDDNKDKETDINTETKKEEKIPNKKTNGKKLEFNIINTFLIIFFLIFNN